MPDAHDGLFPSLGADLAALADSRGYTDGRTPGGARAWLSWPHLTWAGCAPFDGALVEPQLLWPAHGTGGVMPTPPQLDDPNDPNDLDARPLDDLHRAAADYVRRLFPDRGLLPNPDTQAKDAYGLGIIETAPERTQFARLHLRAALYPLLNETVLAIRAGEPFGSRWERWGDDAIPPPATPAAVDAGLAALHSPETWRAYGRGLNTVVAFILDVRDFWTWLARGAGLPFLRWLLDEICEGYPVPEPVARSVRYAVEGLAPEVHAVMLDAYVWSARRLALAEWIAGPERPRPRDGTWASRILFASEADGRLADSPAEGLPDGWTVERIALDAVLLHAWCDVVRDKDGVSVPAAFERAIDMLGLPDGVQARWTSDGTYKNARARPQLRARAHAARAQMEAAGVLNALYRMNG